MFPNSNIDNNNNNNNYYSLPELSSTRRSGARYAGRRSSNSSRNNTSSSSSTTGGSVARFPNVNKDSQQYKDVMMRYLEILSQDSNLQQRQTISGRVTLAQRAIEQLQVEPQSTGITAKKLEKYFKQYVANRNVC